MVGGEPSGVGCSRGGEAAGSGGRGGVGEEEYRGR